MPGFPLTYTSGLVLATSISGATETVVATLAGPTTKYPGQTLILSGRCLLTTGSTTTAVICQIRRASVTGTQIGDHTGQTIIGSAGGTNMYACEATDTGVDGSDLVYVLTITNTGGGTGGSAVYGILNCHVI